MKTRIDKRKLELNIIYFIIIYVIILVNPDLLLSCLLYLSFANRIPNLPPLPPLVEATRSIYVPGAR